MGVCPTSRRGRGVLSEGVAQPREHHLGDFHCSVPEGGTAPPTKVPSRYGAPRRILPLRRQIQLVPLRLRSRLLAHRLSPAVSIRSRSPSGLPGSPRAGRPRSKAVRRGPSASSASWAARSERLRRPEIKLTPGVKDDQGLRVNALCCAPQATTLGCGEPGRF